MGYLDKSFDENNNYTAVYSSKGLIRYVKQFIDSKRKQGRFHVSDKAVQLANYILEEENSIFRYRRD